MWRFINRLSDAIESKLSLFALCGVGSLSFALPAWATHAIKLFPEYSPLSWVAAGFFGLLIASLTFFLYTSADKKLLAVRWLKRVRAEGDLVNPLESDFRFKRIILSSFLPPAGGEVEKKTFHKCEIVGPLNIIPIGTSIQRSHYVSADYIAVSDAAFSGKRIKNYQVFRECHFTECKFFNVSFLIRDSEVESFDRMGGCNWITVSSTEISEAFTKGMRAELAATYATKA